MGGRFDHFLIPGDLFGGEALDILPAVRREKAGGVMEPILGIRLFNIHLDLTVWKRIGMNDLGIVVDLQKRVHHRRYTSLAKILCVSMGSIP